MSTPVITDSNSQNSPAFPTYRGKMEYVCLDCGNRFPIDQLHYTCPTCNAVLMLEDRTLSELKKHSGQYWRDLFDSRFATRVPSLRGIFRYYELMAPVLDPQDIICLGEGHTPIIEASPALQSFLDASFSFKNEGQNPSASFKDRGMACAFSYLKHIARTCNIASILGICASTGDTSAAAAMYGAYVGDPIKTAVLLPQGKVTPQQLSQPLGSGATVLEIPGVFDDCMKVVEHLAAEYQIALLNSKNSWRILGQESYAYEVAQHFNWNLQDLSLFVPIGNAGNISAIMSGLLKLYALNIIPALPRLFGVQSNHADPVWRYYAADPATRTYQPVAVRASVAQAAMIGNPVSFPRVKLLAERYESIRPDSFNVIQVTEQSIMDSTIIANRHGHIACTQGGECLAGLIQARKLNLISSTEHAVLDSTAHSLKFSGFQDIYFRNAFTPEYEIIAKPFLYNAPELIASGNGYEQIAQKIAERLELLKIPPCRRNCTNCTQK